ncbi:MAG: sialidase family protein [Bacteroidota bacterium]
MKNQRSSVFFFLLAVHIPLNTICAQWVQTNGPYNGGKYTNALFVHGTTLLAGTYNAGVLRSTDNGATWRKTNLDTIEVNAFATAGGQLFAGTGNNADGKPNGVFRSTDNGVSWVQTGLDSVRIGSLTANGDTLFAGTDYPAQGIFRSTNQGTTWTRTPTSLESVLISALGVNNGKLYAGVRNFGRGLFRSTDNGSTWNATGLDSV